MAYKSLLLSISLTFILGYCLTFGLTSPNSILKKIPDWFSFFIIIVVFLLYLVAGWWAFKGFSAHKTSAIISMCLCTFGIGLYLVGISMELGGDKASPGQYDRDFSRLDVSEKNLLTKIAQNSGLSLTDATFTEHWHLAEKAPGFRVCVQKGHVTALNFSGHKVPDLAPFSQLPKLEVLYLNNCGLSDMSDLHSDIMDRLELADNQISAIKTLGACPNIGWLVLRNNQLTTTDGIELFTKLVSKDLSGNPLQQ